MLASLKPVIYKRHNKSVLPRWAGVTRRLAAVLGPLHFAFANGHFRSSLTQLPSDASGKPIPWYTYPAIDFLNQLDLTQCNVLEFGPGNSTLWWARKAQRVLALEPDEKWYQRLSGLTAAMSNVEVRKIAYSQDCSGFIEPETYDVIIVDGGGDRPLHARTAFRLVKRTGLVIIDNSNDGYGDHPGHFPMIDDANAGGWLRVDFIGYCPGATRTGSTSVFFRPEVALFSQLGPPDVPQIRRAA